MSGGLRVVRVPFLSANYILIIHALDRNSLILWNPHCYLPELMRKEVLQSVEKLKLDIFKGKGYRARRTNPKG